MFAAMNEVELPLEAGVVPDETAVGDWYLRRVEQGQCMRVRW